jgi:hypothetical protein
LIRGLLGLLLTALLGSIPAMAQQDRPLLRLLVFGADAKPIHTEKSMDVDDTAVAARSSRRGRGSVALSGSR